ncbi:MAG TPA: TonB family protein [Thermoanaerobaculia bacterium]|jgi:TonB family protein|nr:TonB family protein [Thermoanaerobaculia bacterium]
MTDSRTRHGRGLVVVIFLAVLFFILLAGIILKSGGKKDEPAAAVETMTVLSARIRIRTEPHARAPVVATASSGDRVTLLEDRGAWVRVQTADGLAGWAERSALEKTAEVQRRLARYKAIRGLPPLQGVASDRVQLYAGPGIFYPLTGELAEGTQVVVYTRDHDFYAIENGKSIAYATVDAIDVSASGSPQLDVQTASAEPTDTSAPTTSMPPIADTTTTEQPPIPEPAPIPAPEPVERSTGVYAAVPPGGTQPEEIDRVMPRYPAIARRRNVGGAVVVRGIVRRDGTIDNVEVIKDLPFGLGEEARRAVSQWRFRPATYRGEPIDVYYTVTVNFRLQ